MDEIARTVAKTIGRNIRAYRQLRDLDQGALARRLQNLAIPWRRVTVSEVERGERNVTVPELVALTLALGGVRIEQLIDPRGPERRVGPSLALSERSAKNNEGPLIAPDDVTALVCSHNAYAAVEWDDQYPTIVMAGGNTVMAGSNTTEPEEIGSRLHLKITHGPDVPDVKPEGPSS